MHTHGKEIINRPNNPAPSTISPWEHRLSESMVVISEDQQDQVDMVDMGYHVPKMGWKELFGFGLFSGIATTNAYTPIRSKLHRM